MIPLVVLASGRGSNFEALHRAISEGKLQGAELRAVISDRPDAGVLVRARELGIPAQCVPFVKGTHQRETHGQALLEALTPLQPRFLVLAGYMRVLSTQVIEAFRDSRGYSRIVNIHPSLLPAFPGVNSYAQAYHYGVKVTGVTVHLVEEGVDMGPICAQQAFSIQECRSEKEVETLGLAIEHQLFPATLNWLIQEKFQIEKLPQGRLCVRKN